MYRVEWEADATDHFAALSMLHQKLWKDINTADNDITKKLKLDPLNHSRPMSEGLRRIDSGPLVVYFSIDGNLVVVEAVGWIDP